MSTIPSPSETTTLERFYIGVDVGTGSARAALVDATGRILRTHVGAIRTWNPLPDHFEQSSEDIWRTVCECVQSVSQGVVPNSRIVGIGFDATCSLVAIDADHQPCSLSTSASNEQNIIMWMDHRAAAQCDRINRTAHPILRHVGGAVSLEMQTPKLLWCKENVPAQYARARWFFDLPDFLTYRSCGRTESSASARSLCSTICKWQFDAAAGAWPADLYVSIGLGDLMANGAERIGGQRMLAPGTPLAGGLTAEAAAELGLVAGTAVAASMIDAHAGALAMLGCRAIGEEKDEVQIGDRMAIICGTSACHMSVTPPNTPSVFPAGIWGPYRGALFADSDLHEAGQSAAGLLLEHICRTHPAYAQLKHGAGEPHAYEQLNARLPELAQRKGVRSVHELTVELHVWPDYHGNRSPLADATLAGMLSGLTMSTDVDALAVLYLATVQALAYGTLHILDTLQASGRPPISTLILGGGLSRNALYVQTHADVCERTVLLPQRADMVLLGAAMLGARAAGDFGTLQAASGRMAGLAQRIEPRAECAGYHRRKYAVFRRMVDDQRAYRRLMASEANDE